MSSIVADYHVSYKHVFLTLMAMSDYPILSLEQLAQFDAATTHIVTANNRLSVFVKSALLKQLTARAKIISLPTITPYKAWLAQLSDDFIFHHPEMPIVLNEQAQQWYWEQTLSRDEQGRVLLSKMGAVALLSQAHRLETEWQIEVKELTPEYEMFQKWRQLYQESIAAIGAWDTPRLMMELLNALPQQRLPKVLVLVGFYAMSAYQKNVLQKLAESGTALYILEVHREEAQDIQVFRARDPQHELLKVLEWAKEHIEQKPEQKIALVIPSLQEDVAKLRRILSQTFKASVLDKRWHIAVGRPLSEWGLVRSAIAWFSLITAFQKEKVDISLVGEALLNAEFAFNHEAMDRFAVWDSRLREGNDVRIGREFFLYHLNEVHEGLSRVFEQQLSIWRGRKTCADWAQIYRDTLTQFGFPGQLSLSSVNYQLCRSFEQAIKKFALLDEMLPSLDAQQALSLFQRQLQGTSFQAQRHQDVVLDVVGLYETEGGQWDAVWVLGLTDSVLPQMSKPNPYIPIHSQRRAYVMHATPESEMQWAREVFNGILHSAPLLRLSWYQQKGEDAVLPTSFLKSYEVLDLYHSEEDLIAKDKNTSFDVSKMCEFIEDNKGLAKTAQVKGGYGVLERQSKNPLWAYATLRLNLMPLKDYPESELSSFMMGNLLHLLIEEVYKPIPLSEGQYRFVNQGDLYNDEWINERLENGIEQARTSLLSSLSSETLKNLCLEKAKEVVLQMIQNDKEKRVPFETIAVEKKYSITQGALNFEFKVDRIDRNEQGQYIFIDYKTGALKNSGQYKEQWLNRERLTDLQLPLYATMQNNIVTTSINDKSGVTAQDVAGIAFASLSRDKKAYIGMWQVSQLKDKKWTSDEEILDKDGVISSDDWSEATQKWQAKIDLLCQEIAEGEASNRSLSKDDLKYCEITPFLRLHGDLEGEQND